MKQKWSIDSKTYSNFIKIHLAVEVSTHTHVAVILTDERVGDSRMLILLIEKCRASWLKVKEILADGALDSKSVFKYLGFWAKLTPTMLLNDLNHSPFFRSLSVFPKRAKEILIPLWI
ncbi:MAG: transposase [Promethearchaeota archaeon]